MECANVFNVNKTYCTHLKVINNKLATRIVGNRSRPIFNPRAVNTVPFILDQTNALVFTITHLACGEQCRDLQTSSPIGQGCDLQTAIRCKSSLQIPPDTPSYPAWFLLRTSRCNFRSSSLRTSPWQCTSCRARRNFRLFRTRSCPSRSGAHTRPS